MDRNTKGRKREEVTHPLNKTKTNGRNRKQNKPGVAELIKQMEELIRKSREIIDANGWEPEPPKRQTPMPRPKRSEWERCQYCDGFNTYSIEQSDGSMLTTCYRKKCGNGETKYPAWMVNPEPQCREKEPTRRMLLRRKQKAKKSGSSPASSVISSVDKPKAGSVSSITSTTKPNLSAMSVKAPAGGPAPAVAVDADVIPPPPEFDDEPVVFIHREATRRPDCTFLSCKCGKPVFICCHKCMEPLCEDHVDCDCDSQSESVKDDPKQPKMRGGKDAETQTAGHYEIVFIKPPTGCSECGESIRMTSASTQTEVVEEPQIIHTGRLRPSKVKGWCQKSKQMKEIEVLDMELFYYLATEGMYTNKGPSTISNLKGKAKLWLDKNRPSYTTQERFEVISSCVLPAMIPRDGEMHAQTYLGGVDNTENLRVAAGLMNGEISSFREFSLRGAFGLRKINTRLPKIEVA